MLLEYRKLSDDKFPYKSRVNSEAVAKVMKYTEENYSKPIKLADMAAVAGGIRTAPLQTFQEKFQHKTNGIFKHSAHKPRKGASYLLLKDSCGDSFETGFSDSSYFYVVFKKSMRTFRLLNTER